MLQKPRPGTQRTKRHAWCRKSICGREVRASIRVQKKQFQRRVRNGKPVDLPSKGCAYKKVPNREAKWALTS